MKLSFLRCVKPRIHYESPALTETEEKERFWQKVIIWISNEISRANLRNLEGWAWECGYVCAKERTDLPVSRVKECAIHVKKLMSEHTVAEKAQIIVCRELARLSFNSLRAFVRRCGFANQQDFPETAAGFREFVSHRSTESLQEFDENEMHAIGSAEALADALKLHMQTNEKMHSVSLLSQKPDPNEPCSNTANRITQIVQQIRLFVEEHARMPLYSRNSKLSGCDPEWERKLHKHVAYAQNVIQYDMSARASRMRKLFDSIPGWSWRPQPSCTYEANDKLEKQQLHTWSDVPFATAPLTCQLCGFGCVDQDSFMTHVQSQHSSYSEYRKRVLHLASLQGPRRLTASEKRSIVQNYAFHESTSSCGTQSNNYPKTENVIPRCENACVICARIDWREHRVAVKLFARDSDTTQIDEVVPVEDESDEDIPEQHNNVPISAMKHKTFISAAKHLNQIFSVDRYAERWPNIPKSELLAASVQHPEYEDMRWLLHTRRIPMQQEYSGPCAGVADPHADALVCPDCFKSIARKKAKLPKYALVNDLWIGRWHPKFQDLTDAMRWLLSLARPVWRTVYLGKSYEDQSAKQVGCASNSLLVAQPTAGLPTKVLPPADGHFEDTFVVAFTTGNSSLEHAKWATCSRKHYLECASIRKEINPAFQDVTIDVSRAEAEIPENGVPSAISRCCCHLEENTSLTTQFRGPASAPNVQTQEIEKVEEESDDTTCEENFANSSSSKTEQLPLTCEDMVATNPSQEGDAVHTFSVFQKKMEEMSKQADAIRKAEATIKVQCRDGTFISVCDVGGRAAAGKVVQDLNIAAKNLTSAVQQQLEQIAAEADGSHAANRKAFLIPTGKPLSMFSPEAWTCSFPEFFFGDGTPGLARSEPLLIEELFACLQTREELEYALPEDDYPYLAQSPNRFVRPDILACMHDTKRRLGIITGARACLSRSGFKADIVNMAKVTVQDFLAASNTTTASDALADSTLADSAKACLKSLLFATATVPGTEGYRVRQRHLGVNMNLLFNPCVLFFTLNFSDTRSPIVVKINQGPGSDSSKSRKIDLFNNDIDMPSLRAMHELIARNPSSQGRFFLLKHELFIRHVLGLGIFHYGKMAFEKWTHQEDSFSGSLQPALVFAPAAGFGLGEAQARGFKHTHNKLHATSICDVEFFHHLVNATDSEVEKQITLWQRKCLDAASSIVFESSTEIGRQLDVALPKEPFSEAQQKRSRLDGNLNLDGTSRTLLPVAPPLKLAHIAHEEERAKELNVLPRGSFDVPLTYSSHSTSPAYRLLQSFPLRGNMDVPRHPPDTVPFNQELQQFILPSAEHAGLETLQADATNWARAFALDAFELHVPLLQMWFAVLKGLCTLLSGFRFSVVFLLARSFALVPGRGACGEVTGRSNIDLQWTTRLPILSNAVESEDATLDRATSGHLASLFLLRKDVRVSKSKQALLLAVAAAFRAAHCADYYITKYASKSLQTFSPLMRQLADSIAALERDEKQEKIEEDQKLQETTNHQDQKEKAKKISAVQPVRRARRVLFRMCFAVNRSFWLSCTELYVILTTGASGWQTHAEKPLFLARLLFMARHAKQLLEKHSHHEENVEEPAAPLDMNEVELSFADDENDNEPNPKLSQTTSVVDDYMHRGPQWKDMSLYLYCMHVRRVPRSRFQSQSCQVVFFDPHYKLFRTYVQRLNFYCAIPRLIGPHIPTIEQDAETNALIKGVLFHPFRCKGLCTDCSMFNCLLVPTKRKLWSFNLAWQTFRQRAEFLADRATAFDAAAQKMHSIADCVELRGWLPTETVQQSLKPVALRTVVRCIVDEFLPVRCMFYICQYLCASHTCVCETNGEPEACPTDGGHCVSLHPGYHYHQPSLQEFDARLCRRITTNLDLAAEARIKPPKTTNSEEVPGSESESDTDKPPVAEEELFLGPDFEDALDAVVDDDLPMACAYAFLLPQGQEAADFALRKDIVLNALKAKRPTSAQKMLSKYYAIFSDCFEKRPDAIADILPSNGVQLSDNFPDAMAAQAKWIEATKKQQNLNSPDDLITGTPTPLPDPCENNAEIQLLNLGQENSPAAVAWALMQKFTASEDQINFMSLLVAPMQKAWLERPCGTEVLPPVNGTHYCRVIGLGGGGCGKSWMLNHMIRPLIRHFFHGINSYYPLCATNAGARLIFGRTFHAACGLGAKAALHTPALLLTGDTKKKLEYALHHVACVAGDEISQVGAPLLHASNLRFMYARMWKHSLNAALYMQPANWYGKTFAVLLLGDFFQLPPVPESSGLLEPALHGTHEQKQGRAMVENFEFVYEFTSAQRFQDENLVQILGCMRSGAKMSDQAWTALKATALKPQDRRLEHASEYYECSYSWQIVSLAQQIRPKISAAKSNTLLYYIQALDSPARHCTKQECFQMLQTPSLSDTEKLMGILPVHIGLKIRLTKLIVAPELTPEREGVVVGIEFRQADQPKNWPPATKALVQSCGHYVCTEQPHAIYVRICDYKETILPPVPCSAHKVLGADKSCPQCQHFEGVIAIRPTTAAWNFRVSSTETIDVKRTQFAIAPATAKTNHSMQGSTADPGLIAHWATPNVSETSSWLSKYVLLSRDMGQLAKESSCSFYDRGEQLLEELGPLMKSVSRAVQRDAEGTLKMMKIVRVGLEEAEESLRELTTQLTEQQEALQMALELTTDPVDPLTPGGGPGDTVV
eukprot:s390_g5.t1